MAERKVRWSLVDNDPDSHQQRGIKHGTDVVLTFTCEGIEVDGFFDSRMMGIGLATIPWAEVDAARAKVEGV